MLRKYVNERKDDWDIYLDTCTFAYNTSRHESTLHTPFEVMFGRKPVIPIEVDADGAHVLEEMAPDSVNMESFTSYRQDLMVTVMMKRPYTKKTQRWKVGL